MLSALEAKNILRKALFIESFERSILSLEERKILDISVYLGLGQEYIAASLATYYEDKKIAIFAQHRAHSYYLAFGGNPLSLRAEILGDTKAGCARGFGGSVGIYSKEINMFGHSGLMGEQIYLGVGWSFATQSRALVVMGDATIEEDYALPSVGFAAKHNLPVTFICEDNGFAVLTPTSKRRSWSASEVVGAFGVKAIDIEDDPSQIFEALDSIENTGPVFLNIRTQRKNRHVGAHLEGDIKWDRKKIFEEFVIDKIGAAAFEALELEGKTHEW
jgi:TPP-dependent pyruvate/acetoin dehydrogenase alpha subunit